MSRDDNRKQSTPPSEVVTRIEVPAGEVLALLCVRCKRTENRSIQQLTYIDGDWHVTAYGPPPAGWTKFSYGELCPACTIEVERFLAAPMQLAENFLRGLVDAVLPKKEH